jgi:hypothetical protein
MLKKGVAMIRHIVVFKMKASAEGKSSHENLVDLKGLLESLAGKIPEIKRFEVGVNINPSVTAYDLILDSDFDDEMALITYQKHPLHQEVLNYINQVCADRKVVDWEVHTPR